jgi:MFS family permease
MAWRQIAHGMGNAMPATRCLNAGSLLWRVFLPFVLAYFLSYLLRNVNAVVAPQLAHDFRLDAGQLGSLTAVYFLGFAAVQIPLGACLDRFGPVRVQVPLCLLAALGATIFSYAQSPWQLVAGRLIVGIGVAAGLIAGLKTIALWFPKDRVPMMNGTFVAFGTLGAVAATAPTEWLLTVVDWRGLFQIFACALVLIALSVSLLVPASPGKAMPEDNHGAQLTYGALFKDQRFWRLAPLSGLSIGSAWALQGLWAAAWMSDVGGFDRATLVTQLFIMSLVLSASALGLGATISHLKHWGVGPSKILPGMVMILMVAELMLTTRHPYPSIIAWCLVAMMSAGTVATYSITADVFEKPMLGRVNGAINLFHIGGAFVIQCAVGLILSRWEPTVPGHYPVMAYTVMLVVLILVQAAALAWYLRPWKSGTSVLRTLIEVLPMRPVR